MTLAALYETFLFDLDGVVYLGDSPIEGAAETVARLREDGKRVVFLTNDPRLSPSGYADKLTRLGIDTHPNDVVTSVTAVMTHLRRSFDLAGKTAFVVGSADFKREVTETGIRLLEGGGKGSCMADFVIVAGHDDFSYAELKTASLAVRAGAGLYATNRDAFYPTPEGLVPGTGAILAAIEAASEGTAVVGGKPGPLMFEAALARAGGGGAGVVIGDRLDTDILGGQNAGLASILVLTGTTGPGELESSAVRPDHVIDSIADLYGDR